jgi:hypothetical protein
LQLFVSDLRIILLNRAHLRAYMQQTLENMIFYRGDIKLTVQFGTPVLFQYSLHLLETEMRRYPGRGLEFHELETFIRIMRDPKIQSELVR